VAGSGTGTDFSSTGLCCSGFVAGFPLWFQRTTYMVTSLESRIRSPPFTLMHCDAGRPSACACRQVERPLMIGAAVRADQVAVS